MWGVGNIPWEDEEMKELSKEELLEWFIINIQILKKRWDWIYAESKWKNKDEQAYQQIKKIIREKSKVQGVSKEFVKRWINVFAPYKRTEAFEKDFIEYFVEMLQEAGVEVEE